MVENPNKLILDGVKLILIGFKILNDEDVRFIFGRNVVNWVPLTLSIELKEFLTVIFLNYFKNFIR